MNVVDAQRDCGRGSAGDSHAPHEGEDTGVFRGARREVAACDDRRASDRGGDRVTDVVLRSHHCCGQAARSCKAQTQCGDAGTVGGGKRYAAAHMYHRAARDARVNRARDLVADHERVERPNA